MHYHSIYSYGDNSSTSCTLPVSNGTALPIVNYPPVAITTNI